MREMKLAICSKGPSLDDSVDDRFGRCRYLLLVENGKVERVVKDPSSEQSCGAGVRTAQIVVENGATAVLGGKPGPNAMRILRESGIEVFIAKSMSGKEALIAFEKGLLIRCEEREYSAEDVVMHGFSSERASYRTNRIEN
ncbi:MAG: NifB/NifX family molybdenum-iron cluster-binding protein [Methanomassiliicoccales archaeon]